MTRREFWDLYESELTLSVTNNPEDYLLGDHTPEAYAKAVRNKMERTKFTDILLSSNTFKRVAKRVGITKFSQGRLKIFYEGLDESQNG